MIASRFTQSQGQSKSPSEVRLVEVLDAYLAAAQDGVAPAREELLAKHPELAEDLEACLASLEFIRQASLTNPPLVADAKAVEATDGEPGIGDLGDFRLIAEVGRGGMGVVYEAVQRSLNRRVALKVLPFAAAMDPTQLRRFQTEALAAAQLHHTHIVPVYSVGCERGVHYYAMQFIEGQTLAQAIAERRRHSSPPPPVRRAAYPSPPGEKMAEGQMRGDCPAETADRRSPIPETPRKSTGSAPSSRSREYFRTAAALGIQAAEGLDHAHKLGIVHRDIKPANLLLDVHGNLWITDFGLARLQDDAGLTITGDLLGTLRYMSPEQALAKRGYLDHRTDIYSLGATLYELVTLRPAVDGQDRQEVLRKIEQDEPTPPRRLNAAIPRELETILLKAMNKEPGSRYTTARELADDLDRFLEHKPIGAKRPTLADRAAKWGRRHRTVVRAALVVLIMATAGLAGSIVLIARERAEAVRQRDSARTQFNAANAARNGEAQAREQAEAVSRFLVDSFRRPDPSQDGHELKVVDLLTSAADKLDTEFAGAPLIRAELLNALGLTFNGLGFPARAAEIHQSARTIREKLLGTDHPDTISSCENLVGAYLDAGRAAEALALAESTLNLRESKLGHNDPQTLQTRGKLALAYAKMGRTAEAIALCEATLKLMESNLGHDHLETLSCRSILAAALSAAGRNDEALVQFRAILELRESKLGPDHIETLNSRNNLAFALTNAGRVAESIPLIEATLKLRESKLGPDHPLTLVARNNVAVAYWKAGRLDISVPLFELVLKQRTTNLGPDHPLTLKAQANLGVNYRDAGRPAEGARVMEEALRRAEGRPELKVALRGLPTDLAAAYDSCGWFARAEALYRDELAAARKSFGPEDARTVERMRDLGMNLMRQEKWSEAEHILRESLAVREKIKPDAWHTFNARWLLGGALVRQGRYAEAELLLVQGYEGMRAREATVPSAGRASLTEGAKRLARIYDQRGRRAEAAAWRARLGLAHVDPTMPNGADAFAH